MSSGFKGNKQELPSKPCAGCGRPMSWRRKWAQCWEQVKYCSGRCRRQRRAMGEPRLRLGDRLSPPHIWFAQPRRDLAYLLLELRQKTGYVLHHARKPLAVLATMRDFARQLFAGLAQCRMETFYRQMRKRHDVPLPSDGHPAGRSIMHFSRLFTSLLLAASLLAAGCSTLPPDGIRPVSGFSLARYSGNWYEIARLDHSFERGLSDVSASYSQDGDGSIRVLNRGYDATSGRWKQALGRALFNFDPQTASLKVSFFGPFYGGYHVVALDPDYRWALVAGNNRNYLWILARERQLPAEVRSALLQQARSLGFDTDQLIWVSHSRTQP